MYVAAAILSVLLAAAFGMSGFGKVTRQKSMVTIRDRLGVSPQLWQTVGGLELLAAAGLLFGLAVAIVGIAAAVGLVLLMVGAVLTHVRAREPGQGVPAAVLGVLAAVLVVLRSAA